MNRFYQVVVKPGVSRAFAILLLAVAGTVSAPMGSLWGTFLHQSHPFSIDACLAAADPGCWPVGIRQLEYKIDEALDRGLLDSHYDWGLQIAEGETPADLMRPHVDSLLKVADRASEPTVLAPAIRLLGYSGDDRAAASAMQLVDHEDPLVQDAAAIALGLLRRDEGLDRIDAILERPQPAADDPLRHADYKTKRQALVALSTVRSDASIELVRKWMRIYVDGTETVKTEHGTSRAGTSHQADQLAMLLGQLNDARYLGILTEAVVRLESRADLGDNPDVHEPLASICRYDESARDFIDSRVRRGDVATLYALGDSRDAHYVDALRAMLDAHPDAQAWHWAIGYLWNIGSVDAIDVLREAYDRGIPAGEDHESIRLRLAAALAQYGDNRGLPAALTVLCDAADPGDPPIDGDALKKWQQQLDRRRDEALDVLDRAGTKAVVQLLKQHAHEKDPGMRLALLQILNELHTLPDAVRPHVERWAADASSQAVAQQASRLLSRHR